MNSKIEPINNIFSGLNVISILNIAKITQNENRKERTD
jgi:hypothetical protein